MIKHICSDIGNVILNCDVRKVCDNLAWYSDKDCDFFVKLLFGSDNLSDSKISYTDLSLKNDKGLLKPFDFYEEIKKQYNLNIDYKKFKKIWCDIFELNDYISYFLKKMQKNYSTSVISNIGQIHFDHIYENFQIIKGFDDYVLSYVFGYVKPEKEIFTIALERIKNLFSINPDECLFIDDRIINCDEAKKAGMSVLHFSNFFQDEFAYALKDLKINIT